MVWQGWMWTEFVGEQKDTILKKSWDVFKCRRNWLSLENQFEQPPLLTSYTWIVGISPSAWNLMSLGKFCPVLKSQKMDHSQDFPMTAVELQNYFDTRENFVVWQDGCNLLQWGIVWCQHGEQCFVVESVVRKGCGKAPYFVERETWTNKWRIVYEGWKGKVIIDSYTLIPTEGTRWAWTFFTLRFIWWMIQIADIFSSGQDLWINIYGKAYGASKEECINFLVTLHDCLEKLGLIYRESLFKAQWIFYSPQRTLLKFLSTCYFKCDCGYHVLFLQVSWHSERSALGLEERCKSVFLFPIYSFIIWLMRT